MALILAATPLGNPKDASARLMDAIATADVIAAEDSRRFHRLASDLGVTFVGKVISFFDGNEEERTQEILELTVTWLIQDSLACKVNCKTLNSSSPKYIFFKIANQYSSSLENMFHSTVHCIRVI